MVAVPQVQIPNFVGTLGQVEQVQQSRLQAMAARAAMEEAQQFNAALPSLTPALMAGEGPEYDAAVARLGGMGTRGLQVALPLMQDARLRREFNAWQQGGGGQAPAAPVAPAGGGDPMQRIAAVESGGNDAARNPRSSAAGRFQIIDSTWRQYAPRLGLTDAQRMDPAAQEQVARAIQADARQAIGRDLSPGEAYGAHFLGVGGLRAFANAPRDADAQQVYAQAAGPQVAAQAFRANPGLLEPGMTVGQVMDALGRRMGGQGGATPAAAIPAARAGIDPAELRRIEMGLASPNPMIQRAAQARLQALQLQQRDPTDSFREEARDIGGRRVAGQVNLRTGQFTAYPGQTREENDGPFASGAVGQAGRYLTRTAPRVQSGEATPQEVEDFRAAYAIWSSERIDPTTQQRSPGLPATPGVQRALDALAQRERTGGQQPGGDVTGQPVSANPLAQPPRREEDAAGNARIVQPAQTTTAAREAARKMEVEAGRVNDAIRGFIEALDASGGTGISTFFNNPQDPAAVRINTAYNNLVTALRSEAFLNTGVLQPGEVAMISRNFLDPQSLRGLLASRDTYRAQMGELQRFIEAGLTRARAAADLPTTGGATPAPAPAGGQGDTVPTVAGPGGRGFASPPPRLPPPPPGFRIVQ